MILIVMFCVLIISLIYVCKIKSHYFSIFDLFLLSNLLFVVFYPILDVLGGGVFYDSVNITYIYFYLGFSFLFVGLVYKGVLNKKIKDNLSFKKAVEKSSAVDGRWIFLVFIFCFMTLFYYFKTYGFIFRVYDNDILENEINSYNIVVSTLVLPMFYFVQICSLSKLYIEKNKKYLILLIFLALYFVLYSRREFLLFIIIWYLFHSIIKNVQYPFHPRNFFKFLGVIIVFIMASNLYQNVRNELFNYSSSGEVVLEKNIIESMVDLNATTSNLEDRGSIMIIFSKIIEGSFSNVSSNGEVTIEAFKTSIPSIIYPGKISVNEDYIISKTLNIPYTDYGASMPMLLIMDFNWFALVLYPLLILVTFYFSFLMMKLTSTSKFINLLIFCLLLRLMFNVEGGVSSFFLFYRQIFILYVLYICFSIFYKGRIVRF